MKKDALLRRYTNLAATLHLLRQREITLLDPSTWDDRNDSFFLATYKANVGAKSVLALCFTEAPETYHHWRVFAPGVDGVCIEFKKDDLLRAFKGDPAISSKSVSYMKVDVIERQPPKVAEMPFIKRYPYRDEQEFRVVLTDKKKTALAKAYAIALSDISRITLSPWMPEAFKDSVKDTIWSIKGCEDLNLNRSTLVENDRWKSAISKPGRD